MAQTAAPQPARKRPPVAPMSKNPVLAKVLAVPPPWKRWTVRHRIPPESIQSAMKYGPNALVAELEALVSGGMPTAVLAGIWVLSCPCLPWSLTLGIGLGRWFVSSDNEDFMVLDAAQRRMANEDPALCAGVLSAIASETSKPERDRLILFPHAGAALTDPELFLYCVKQFTGMKKRKGRPKGSRQVALDGLLFAEILRRDNSRRQELVLLASSALSAFDERAWRRSVSGDDLCALSRDLLGLVCLVGTPLLVEQALSRVMSWLEDVPPDSVPRAATVLGRPVRLLEEGLAVKRPWITSAVEAQLERLEGKDWALSWVGNLRDRVSHSVNMAEVPQARAAWGEWLDRVEEKGTDGSETHISRH